MKSDVERDVAIVDRIMRDLARAFAIEDIKEVLDIDINFSYLSILCQIHILGKPAMGELAKESSIQLSTLTRVMDKLVDRGFAVRKADPSDRRVVRVDLTPEGEKIVKQFEEARKKRIESVLQQLTEREREDLVEILQNIYNRIFGKKEEKNGN